MALTLELVSVCVAVRAEVRGGGERRKDSNLSISMHIRQNINSGKKSFQKQQNRF